MPLTSWGRLKESFVLFSWLSHMSWLSTHLGQPKRNDLIKNISRYTYNTGVCRLVRQLASLFSYLVTFFKHVPIIRKMDNTLDQLQNQSSHHLYVQGLSFLIWAVQPKRSTHMEHSIKIMDAVKYRGYSYTVDSYLIALLPL